MKFQYKHWTGPYAWLTLILLGAALLRIVMIDADHFLHDWDERFHALVAKNLLLHPLKPTLYEHPLLPFDPQEWSTNHLWLSKPILPLWGIALSLKLFGISEWAVRLPSLLFSLAAIVLTFRIARRLFDAKVALWAAFLHAIHGLTLEISTGRFSSDHVDTVFVFWMELGLWLCILYEQETTASAKRRTALWLGVVGGIAFLCKWTAAFFLPLVWILAGVFRAPRETKTLLKDALLAAAGGLIVTAPWLGYLWSHYPQASKAMVQGLLQPVNQVVQGHAGTWYFYLLTMLRAYGELVFIPVLWFIYQTFAPYFKKNAVSGEKLLIAAWMLVPLLLLSASATKRINYLLPLAPAFFIVCALFIRYAIRNFGRSRWAFGLLLAAVVLPPIRYGIERSKIFMHYDTYPAWAMRLKTLASEQGDRLSHTVIFDEPHPIEAMFYTGATAYGWIPDKEVLLQLKKDGWKIMVNRQGEYVEQ